MRLETGNWKLAMHPEGGGQPVNHAGWNRYAWIALTMALMLLVMVSGVHAKKGAYDWALVRLDYARHEKVQQLEHFCDRMHLLAQQASGDESVLKCFEVIRRYRELAGSGKAPAPLVEKVAQMKGILNQYYIDHYFSFYDMLFVNRLGKVFYTIRKETDMNRNFLAGDLADTPLGQCLAGMPEQEAFVDFHMYGPSGEPAAFFVEPVHMDGEHSGWLVLQCAINKANTIFAWTEDLGQTGETFLVNRDGIMLTDSSFEGNSTVLKKHLDDQNIQAKFAKGCGHRTVTDYRGHICLTSFKVVNFMDTRWLVVAKEDKAEIVTRHYTQHRRYYGDRLLKDLEKKALPPSRDIAFSRNGTARRVDMDEFLKAGQGASLQTMGVATCTGLIVACPEQFAYLAHISPRDKVYGADATNLLGQVLKKVETFDIRPFEKPRLVFIVVTTHLDSLLPIIDKLIAEGFLLDQIRMLYNPQSRSASIGYDCTAHHLIVEWHPLTGNKDRPVIHTLKDACNAGAVIQKVMYSEQEVLMSDSCLTQ